MLEDPEDKVENHDYISSAADGFSGVRRSYRIAGHDG